MAEFIFWTVLFIITSIVFYAVILSFLINVILVFLVRSHDKLVQLNPDSIDASWNITRKVLVIFSGSNFLDKIVLVGSILGVVISSIVLSDWLIILRVFVDQAARLFK